jgi:hypothetical protein
MPWTYLSHIFVNIVLGVVGPRWRYGDHKSAFSRKGCMLLNGKLRFWTLLPIFECWWTV